MVITHNNNNVLEKYNFGAPYSVGRFQVLTVLLLKFQVFWHITPRQLANSCRHLKRS